MNAKIAAGEHSNCKSCGGCGIDSYPECSGYGERVYESCLTFIFNSLFLIAVGRIDRFH